VDRDNQHAPESAIAGIVTLCVSVGGGLFVAGNTQHDVWVWILCGALAAVGVFWFVAGLTD
jgi:hypothetical protein